MKLISAGILVLAVAFVATAADGSEGKISLQELPRAVRSAIRAKYPKGKILQAEKSEEKGEIVYEVEVAVDGKNLSVSLDDEGEIEEIESPLPLNEVPKAVKALLAKKFPGAKLVSAEVVTVFDDGKEEKKLEIELQSEVVVALDGSSLIIKAAEAEDKPAKEEAKPSRRDARAEKKAVKSRKKTKEGDGDDKKELKPDQGKKSAKEANDDDAKQEVKSSKSKKSAKKADDDDEKEMKSSKGKKSSNTDDDDAKQDVKSSKGKKSDTDDDD